MYRKFRERKEFVSGTYGWFKFQDKLAESIVRRDFLQYWGIVGLFALFVGFVLTRNSGSGAFLLIWFIFAGIGVATILWYARWFSFLIVSSTGVLGPSAGGYRRTRILWGRLSSINIRFDQYACLFDEQLEQLGSLKLSFDNLFNIESFVNSRALEGEETLEDYLFDANFLVLSSVSFEEISIFLPLDCDEKNMIIEKIVRGLAWYRTEYMV